MSLTRATNHALSTREIRGIRPTQPAGHPAEAPKWMLDASLLGTRATTPIETSAQGQAVNRPAARTYRRGDSLRPGHAARCRGVQREMLKPRPARQAAWPHLTRSSAPCRANVGTQTSACGGQSRTVACGTNANCRCLTSAAGVLRCGGQCVADEDGNRVTCINDPSCEVRFGQGVFCQEFTAGGCSGGLCIRPCSD